MPEYPRIFLAPRSGEQSKGNFNKTVEGGYKKSDILHDLTASDKEALKEKEVLHIWGNAPGALARWKKMEKGDWVFFYAHGNIVAAGSLLYKTHNPKLADDLWGEFANNISGKKELWENVFFVDGIVKTEIPYSVLKSLANYKPNAVVQGFQPYKAEGVVAMIEKHGSVENFINKYLVGGEKLKGPIPKQDVEHELLTLLTKKRQVILFGPPGTGKTLNARIAAVDLLS